MIFSESRKQDMKARANMLYAVEVALKIGDTDTAKSLGESSNKIKSRINNHDYTQEDAWLLRVASIINKHD